MGRPNREKNNQLTADDLEGLELLKQYRGILPLAKELWAATHDERYREIQAEARDQIKCLEDRLRPALDRLAEQTQAEKMVR